MPPSPRARIVDKENTYYGDFKALEQRKQNSNERARPALGAKSANAGARPSLGIKANRQQSLPVHHHSLVPPRTGSIASRSSSVDTTSIRSVMTPECLPRPSSRDKALFPRPLHPVDFSKLEIVPEVAKPAPNLLDYDLFDLTDIDFRISRQAVELAPLPDLDTAPDFDVEFDESDCSSLSF